MRSVGFLYMQKYVTQPSKYVIEGGKIKLLTLQLKRSLFRVH